MNKEYNPAKFDTSRGNTYAINHTLKCPYYGPGDTQAFKDIWKSKLLGHEVNQLSHLCLNGSYSHLSLTEWNTRCFPTYQENLELRRITGVWCMLTFILGILGNVLTLVAIPYAKWKHRYEFHRTFWTTDVWILHLALCDLLFCIVGAPHYFIPYLGFRYLQGFGWDTVCKVSFVIEVFTIRNDWLLVSFIAMTRAINVRNPTFWRTFCEKKANVLMIQLLSWIIQILFMVPKFLQSSKTFGYHCLMGKCSYIPTGEESPKILANHSWIADYLPYILILGTPSLIIIVSYIIIWLDIRKLRQEKNINHGKKRNDKKKLSTTEIKFIWTILIVCGCFFVCAAPLTIVCNILGYKNDIPFLILFSLMLCQYSVNVFIYAYHSEQYRAAYLDIILLMTPRPFRATIVERMGKRSLTETRPSVSTLKSSNKKSKRTSIYFLKLQS